MPNTQPQFVTSRFKTIALVNVLFNIGTLIVVIYFINNKTVYFETGLARSLIACAAWIIVNLVFGIIFVATRSQTTSIKLLRSLINIHLRLFIGLTFGILASIIPVLAIVEFMGMVAGFFLPFIMLVVAIKQPPVSPVDVFD